MTTHGLGLGWWRADGEKKKRREKRREAFKREKKTPVNDTRGNQGWETAGRLERVPPEAVSVPDPCPPQELHPCNRRVSAITQKASTPSPSPRVPLLLPLRISLPLFSLVHAGFHARRRDQKKIRSLLHGCVLSGTPLLCCLEFLSSLCEKTYSLICFALPCVLLCDWCSLLSFLCISSCVK